MQIIVFVILYADVISN